MTERPHVDTDASGSERPDGPPADDPVAVPNDEASDPPEIRFPDEEGNEHLESG